MVERVEHDEQRGRRGRVLRHIVCKEVCGSASASALASHLSEPAAGRVLRTGEERAPFGSPAVAVAGRIDEDHAAADVKEVEHLRVALKAKRGGWSNVSPGRRRAQVVSQRGGGRTAFEDVLTSESEQTRALMSEDLPTLDRPAKMISAGQSRPVGQTEGQPCCALAAAVVGGYAPGADPFGGRNSLRATLTRKVALLKAPLRLVRRRTEPWSLASDMRVDWTWFCG